MTNNKQQTAVDILCGKLAMKLGIPQAITFYIDHQEEIKEAKEMEKERIETAYNKGTVHGIDYPESTLPTNSTCTDDPQHNIYKESCTDALTTLSTTTRKLGQQLLWDHRSIAMHSHRALCPHTT